MGIRLFSSSSYDKCPTPAPPPNPDPTNFRILHSEQMGSYLIMWVWYPDCTNYEGKKVLMFQNVTLEEISKQKTIDPHFSENKRYHSPIARFEPTPRGWALAKALAEALCAVESPQPPPVSSRHSSKRSKRLLESPPGA